MNGKLEGRLDEQTEAQTDGQKGKQIANWGPEKKGKVMFSPMPLKADVNNLSVNAIFTFIDKQVSPTLEAICTDSIPS